MVELLNKLLRPLFVAAFCHVYPRVPWRREILWFFARHYFVNGSHECEKVVEELTEKGYGVLLNYCTEDARDWADVSDAADMYRRLMDIANVHRGAMHRVMLSVKMSQFGCFWDDPKAGQALERVIFEAEFHGVFVMIDGEPLRCAERQARFGAHMHERHRNTGIRLQAYSPSFWKLLQRAIRENINRKEDKMMIGICKGAYHEREACSARETRKNFVMGAQTCIDHGQPVSLDTHDERIIEEVYDHIAVMGPPKVYPSFGLLYNVKPWLAERLKEEKRNSTVFIYLPVIKFRSDDEDPQWEKFAIRRLLERPTYVFLPFWLWLDRLFGRASY